MRNHLLLADTATRRDLAEEETIVRFGRAVRDTERLDLLYALTVGDSRATGPAAWSTGKAALVRQLFVETDALLERGVVGPGLSAERTAALEVIETRWRAGSSRSPGRTARTVWSSARSSRPTAPACWPR